MYSIVYVVLCVCNTMCIAFATWDIARHQVSIFTTETFHYQLLDARISPE